MRQTPRQTRTEGYPVRSLARALGAEPATAWRRVRSGALGAVTRPSQKRWNFGRGSYCFITDEDVGALWARSLGDVIFNNASEDWLAEQPNRG
ncbi:MAG: hypothetical protein QF898_04650 [SAR202 cluster bacterium]|nr:hypothetical protein [SAR202 cluster bacterium]